MSHKARASYASSQTTALMSSAHPADERSVSRAHYKTERHATQHVSGVYVADPARAAGDAPTWIMRGTRRVHPGHNEATREPHGPVVQLRTATQSRRQLTWTEAERPKTGNPPDEDTTSWTRPLTSPVRGDWEAERSALMQFMGDEDHHQEEQKHAGLENDLSVIKVLAMRVKKMSVQEREDLYSAMRTVVKLAESMTDSEASEGEAQAREKAAFNALINRSSASRAVTAQLERPSSAEAERILNEFEQEEEDILRSTHHVLNSDRVRERSPLESPKQKEDGAEKPRPTLPRSFSRDLVASVWKSSKRLDLSRDWRRDRDSVDKKMRYCRAYKAVAAFVGTAVACLQHEAVMRGSHPQGVEVNLLKAVNLVSSAALVGLVYRATWLEELFARIRLHLRLLVPLDPNVTPTQILKKPAFWLQALVCFIHLPPGITFEFGTLNWTNFIVYRAETIFMALNMLRLYLFWNVFVDLQLVRLPRRHTVSGFTGVLMNSAFTCKQVLNSNQALPVIALFWFCQILFLGYWFRAAESSACLFGIQDRGSTNQTARFEQTSLHPGCQNENAFTWEVWQFRGSFQKVNDKYLWNACWSMFSASTSVGWGDVLPTTHIGRVVAGLSNVLGIVMISLLTSAFMLNLHYSPEEESAILMLEKEKAKQEGILHAVKLLQLWIRMRQSKFALGERSIPSKMREEMYKLKSAFKKCKQLAAIDYRDMVADDVKIDHLAKETKYLSQASEVVERFTAQEFFFPVTQVNVKTTVYDEVDEDKMTAFEFAALSEISRRDQQGKGRGQSSLEQKSQEDQTGPTNERNAGQYTDVTALMMQARVLAKNEKWQWRHNRKIVDQRIAKTNVYAAVSGLTGTLCSIAAHELMIQGDVPEAAHMMLLKLCSSILSIATIGFIYQHYWLHTLRGRLILHLRRGFPLDPDVTMQQVLFSSNSAWLWLELSICLLHVPPMPRTIEFSSTFMGNLQVYRLETIGCAGNILRVYLLWRPILDIVLKSFPSKHNIAAFVGIEFNSTFVVKWMMNSWHAGNYIASAWLFVLLVTSYLFRLAEHTHSCKFPNSIHPGCQQDNAKNWSLYGEEFEKENDLYFWNSCWFIMTCVTPGAGGNVAVATHFGRLVAAFAVIVGVLVGSLTTAALGNLMMLTPAEHTARGILEREASRRDYIIAAVNTISLWWRKRRSPHMITKRQRKMDLYGYRRAFVAAAKVLKVDVEECASRSSKIEQIVSRTKVMRKVMDQVGLNIFSNLQKRPDITLVRTVPRTSASKPPRPSPPSNPPSA